MQEILSSNPPVVTGICDPNKSRARHHRSLELGSKLKYLNKEKRHKKGKIHQTGNRNIIFCEQDLCLCTAKATESTKVLFLFVDYLFLLLSQWKTLCEKCPNTEFFLVLIFPYSDWVRRFTEEISVFSPNTGKYGTEKTPYLDTFHAVRVRNLSFWGNKLTEY